jgi:hypothetical protein
MGPKESGAASATLSSKLCEIVQGAWAPVLVDGKRLRRAALRRPVRKRLQI